MSKKIKMTLNFVSNKETKRSRLSKAGETSIAGSLYDLNEINLAYPQYDVETVTYYPKKNMTDEKR